MLAPAPLQLPSMQARRLPCKPTHARMHSPGAHVRCRLECPAVSVARALLHVCSFICAPIYARSFMCALLFVRLHARASSCVLFYLCTYMRAPSCVLFYLCANMRAPIHVHSYTHALLYARS